PEPTELPRQLERPVTAAEAGQRAKAGQRSRACAPATAGARIEASQLLKRLLGALLGRPPGARWPTAALALLLRLPPGLALAPQSAHAGHAAHHLAHHLLALLEPDDQLIDLANRDARACRDPGPA